MVTAPPASDPSGNSQSSQSSGHESIQRDQATEQMGSRSQSSQQLSDSESNFRSQNNGSDLVAGIFRGNGLTSLPDTLSLSEDDGEDNKDEEALDDDGEKKGNSDE